MRSALVNLFNANWTKYKNIDIVVVRENTEDLYAGVEFKQGSSEANEIIKMSKNKIRQNSAISIKSISYDAPYKIIKFAFDYAVKKRKSYCCN